MNNLSKLDKITKKRISALIVTFIGFLITIKLAIIYYDANFNPYAFSSFCSINEFIDCDGIAKTADSQFLGIPLAYWGMGMYFFVMFMYAVERLKKIKFLSFLEVFKNPFSYIASITLISFCISILLAIISIFMIKKLCILCLVTYFINLIISLLIIDTIEGGYIKAFKDSVLDIFDALKNVKYLITFIVLALTAIGFLVYTTKSMVFAPHVKKISEIQAFAKMKKNPYKVSGNQLGDADAKVIVHLYTDFVCPICYAYNIMIHKAVKELSNVKIIHHNYPLDKMCNEYIMNQVHKNACMMAEFSIAAEKQGRYWDMNSILFENQPKTPEQIISLSKSLNIDLEKLEKDALSRETDQILSKEIDDAYESGIEGTPTIVINGKKYMGIKPYSELKELLIESGAKPRK